VWKYGRHPICSRWD